MSNIVRSDEPDIETFVQSVRNKVQSRLEELFESKSRDAYAVSRYYGEIIDALKTFTLRGGKRVRAALVDIGFRCITDQPPGQDVVDAGAAMELVQSFLLAHDDIVDRDDTRRGAPSLHVELRRWPLGTGDGVHKGIAGSLLAGDVAVVWSLQLVATLGSSQASGAGIFSYFLGMLEKVLAGEILDLAGSSGSALDWKEVESVYELKTASYSFSGPLCIGAILAGAGQECLEALDKAGIPLGIAFQIMDDMLGLFGETAETGKPSGADLKEGKRTLLMLEALSKASAEDRKLLESWLGDRNIDDSSLDRARKIVKATGAVEDMNRMAEELTETALDELRRIGLRERGVTLLEALARYLLQRRG